MKRNILNATLWLAIAILVVLLFRVLTTESPATIPPSISTSHPQEMATLIQERQRLEKELQNLDQEKKDASAGPTSIFVLISTSQEDILREAADMMDQLQLSALMGVSQQMLEAWAQQGVPAYISDRLARGWEICLLLETTPPDQMQSTLTQLHLAPATAAYDTPANEWPLSAEALTQCGISILIEDELNVKDQQDGLWRIGSIGNMNGDGIYLYEQYRNTGAALVNVVGHYRADQTYVKENLEGLLELIHEDSLLGTVQCLHLEAARYYHQQFVQRLMAAQKEWDTRRALLEAQLQSVTDAITDASVLLNQ